jgi:hypothetical protein
MNGARPPKEPSWVRVAISGGRRAARVALPG